MAKQPNPLRIWRAKRAFEDFTGEKPDKVVKRRLDSGPVAGYRLGQAVGVAYEARRDGETAQYFHRFKKAARPELVVRDDGKQLYLTGGNYKVTDRGIEDRDNMAGMFVVNPSSRRRRKASPTRRRRTRTVTMRTNPVRRRRRAVHRRRAVTTYRRNPTPVRRHRRRRASVAVGRRRYRRNPSGGGGKFNLMSTAFSGIMIGAGAVGVEVIMGYLPIPATWKTGPMKYPVKAGLAIGIGMLIAKMGGAKGRRVGELLALGGVVTAAHDMIKDTLAGALPGVKMGSYNWAPYGYNAPLNQSFPRMGYYTAGQTAKGPGMGQYVQPTMAGASPLQRRGI